MNDYVNFSVKDLAADDFFSRWVLQPDMESEMFWKKWLSENPDKEQIVVRAKNLVLALNKAEDVIVSEELIRQTWAHIDAQTRTDGKTVSMVWPKLAAAAAILLIATVAIWLWIDQNNNNQLAVSSTGWEEVSNNGNDVRKVTLDDGTMVTLKPGSSLRYPLHFEKNNRVIQLKGEAFFEVTRDESRPCMVFALETVTKVLGTSFTVKAHDIDDEIEVTVRTGKVAVYANVENAGQLPDDNNKHIIVTPNQKAIFNRKNEDLKKSLAENPAPVIPVESLKKQKFEEAPLEEILESLQEVYQVEILFDKSALKKCRLTTTLNDQSLFEKLSIICDALGLGYRQENAKIIITGEGCGE